MWMKTKRGDKVRSFLTRFFPFLGIRKHKRLEDDGDLRSSKWSLMSTATTTQKTEVSQTPLPKSKVVSSGWNAKREARTKKKAKRFKLSAIFRRRRRRAGRGVVGVGLSVTDLVRGDFSENDDNQANEERIRQMAALGQADTGAAAEREARTTSKRTPTCRLQAEVRKRTKKTKRKLKHKRFRNDKYKPIVDCEMETTEMTMASEENSKLLSTCSRDESVCFVEQRDGLHDHSNIWCTQGEVSVEPMYAGDSVAPSGESVEGVQQTPASAPKNKRKRSLKLSFRKAKRKTLARRYHRMCSSVESLTHTDARWLSHPAKQMKGRMRKLAKSGWKTMKSGMSYYSNGPLVEAKFNPVLRRYEDGFKEFNVKDVIE